MALTFASCCCLAFAICSAVNGFGAEAVVVLFVEPPVVAVAGLGCTVAGVVTGVVGAAAVGADGVVGSTAQVVELSKHKAKKLLTETCMIYPFGKALLNNFTSISAYIPSFKNGSSWIHASRASRLSNSTIIVLPKNPA